MYVNRITGYSSQPLSPPEQSGMHRSLEYRIERAYSVIIARHFTPKYSKQAFIASSTICALLYCERSESRIESDDFHFGTYLPRGNDFNFFCHQVASSRSLCDARNTEFLNEKGFCVHLAKEFEFSYSGKAVWATYS